MQKFRVLSGAAIGAVLFVRAAWGGVVLTWQDNANNEAGFKIERHCGDGLWQEIGQTGINETRFVDSITPSPMQPELTCTYRVYAWNAAGNSGFSNEASATVRNTPPAAPSLLQAVLELVENLADHLQRVARALREWRDSQT